MSPDIIGVFIPIVAIVMGIGIGMLSIWTEHKRKAQLLDQYHRERIAALEKGLPLPELDRRLVALDDSQPPTAARAYRNGVMMLLIGIILYFALEELLGSKFRMLLIGIILYFALEELLGSKFSLFGLVPAAIGIANLLYGVLLQRKESAEQAEKARMA